VKDYLGYPPLGNGIGTGTCEVCRVRGGVVAGSWAYGVPGQLFRLMAGGQEGA
jgi:hypothetical protein